MNKVLSTVLTVLSSIVAILLLISTFLTSEKSIKFFLNFNQDTHIDFVLNDSHWHPYKPSIEIETLSIRRAESERKFVEIEGLKAEFNILGYFQGNLIETFYAKDLSIAINSSKNEDQVNLNNLLFYVSFIRNLIIDEFSLVDSSNYLNTLKG